MFVFNWCLRCSTAEVDDMFCIDFETDDLVSVTKGVYRPWVLNDGVHIINDPLGTHGRVGFFNESHLEIPFFSNAYSSFKSLRISFYYRLAPGGSADQGIISNDCFGGAVNAPGNSLFASAQGTYLSAGFKAPPVTLGGDPVGVRTPAFLFILNLQFS